MTDVTTAGAASVATGVVTIPFLASMGIDPSAMVAGLLGCVVAQSLMPRKPDVPISIKAIVAITLGSVLLASLLTPIAAPWVWLKVSSMVDNTSYEAARALTAGGIGAFAQPIFLAIKGVGEAAIGRFSKKEAGDA